MPNERNFVTARLPWLVGAGGLMIYLITLNKWVSLLNLEPVARISGWSWQPALHQPLTWLVLFPFRVLPEPWIPLALNIFTALCAAFVLMLLARSVALLPHDLIPEGSLSRKSEPRLLSTPTAWMPPVLAAILCGLQLSFWEHATSATAEMIDLLSFAYLIRCVLEFRIDQNESWLLRCALVYAAAMANNWVMIAYCPVFVAAVLRITGLGILYNRRFMFRVMLWGIAGLSLYLLLPLVQSFSSLAQVDFWTALKGHLKLQRDALSSLRHPAFRILALSSLLPLLILSIRWKSHTVQLADDSRLGVFLTKATGHFVHALFLVTSLWLALDPTFSPRHRGLGTPMLSYYYILALVFGYCTGYLLLFRVGPQKKAVAKLSFAAASILLGALPLLLGWRNLGQIRLTNGPVLRDFARLPYADLPAAKSVVLSDDSNQLLLLRAELSAHADKDALLLETRALPSPQYHVYMANKFKSRWPVAPPTNKADVVGPGKLLKLLSNFAAQQPVIYLQPSSGFLFEWFNQQPNGLVHYLKPRTTQPPPSTTPVSSPSPPLEERAGERRPSNQNLWQQRWTSNLQFLAPHTKEKPKYSPAWARPILAMLRLETEPNLTASALGAAYSRSLDDWGVQMERSGDWTTAGVCFQRALQLNPKNLSAHLNSHFNERWQRGEKTRFNAGSTEKQFSDLFAQYNNWREVLAACGPVDEPTFLFRTGRALLLSGNPRQAALEFARSADLAPDWPAPKLWLAQSHIQLSEFAKAIEVTDAVMSTFNAPRSDAPHAPRSDAPPPPPEPAALSRLLYCRATALTGLGRTNEAIACIESFVAQHGKDSVVLTVAAELYAQHAQFEKQLAVLEELLKADANQPELLSKKGLAELQLARYAAAISTLSAALSLAPSDDQARLCRAIASLGANKLDAADADYQQLLKSPKSSKNALFGLGTVALRKQDTNAAIHFYQQYLSNSIPDERQYKIASQRLKELNGPRAN